MAIWQFKLFIVPQTEVNSYFPNSKQISLNDLNEIKWWKYQNVKCLEIIEEVLPRRESWSNDIMLFGNEGSNCLEVLMEKNKIDEVSARIDMRTNYSIYLNALCDFANQNDCIFLDNSLNVLTTNFQILNLEVGNFALNWHKQLDA